MDMQAPESSVVGDGLDGVVGEEWRLCIGMRIDMSIGLRTAMCVDICICRHIDMFIGLRTAMCMCMRIDVCIGLCIDMSAGKCMDMCTGMCIGMCVSLSTAMCVGMCTGTCTTCVQTSVSHECSHVYGHMCRYGYGHEYSHAYQHGAASLEKNGRPADFACNSYVHATCQDAIPPAARAQRSTAAWVRTCRQTNQ